MTIFHNRFCIAFTFFLVFLASTCFAEKVKKQERGAVIYRNQCISCHGSKGEGVKGEYEKPLSGNLSLKALIRQVEKTMPEGEAEECVGAEATAVTNYIYKNFYSKQAQSQPDLCRLTVPQFRQSIADLVGGFRSDWKEWNSTNRGLRLHCRGRHPTKKKGKKKERVKEKRDVPNIYLDYEKNFPFNNIDKKEEIEISWYGSLIAPETGPYEIVIRTQNSIQLWINSQDWESTPFIDAYVVNKPGLRDERKTIFLIKGRSYPIRVECEITPAEKNLTVELLWKTPNGLLQRIPQRAFLHDMRPEVTVVSTPFPPDDASLGYERGKGISPAWYTAITKAALDVAILVSNDINTLAKTNDKDKNRTKKIRKFCEEFAARAFRRPLDEQTRKQLIDVHFSTAKTPELAAKRAILTILCSPRFLYPESTKPKGKPDSYQIAGRLALAIWDSVPDERLRKAAQKNELQSAKNIQSHAWRMLNDPRAKAKLDGFFHHWLELSRAENTLKDQKAFPEFNEQILFDLKTSLHLFLDGVVWSKKSDYRELLQADYLFLNQRLQKFYGYQSGKNRSNQKFERIKIPNHQRSGIITHPYLLTIFSYHDNTSPIHRGVFLTRNIVGRSLKPPPKAIKFEDVGFDPTLTMREKVTKFTRATACMSCHFNINPLGFSLENFDGTGKFRNKENNKPINSSSEFTNDDGDAMRITGAKDVANFAVNSPVAHRAFIRQLFHHMIKQDTSSYKKGTLKKLEETFNYSDFHIQNLWVTIATTAAMQGFE